MEQSKAWLWTWSPIVAVIAGCGSSDEGGLTGPGTPRDGTNPTAPNTPGEYDGGPQFPGAGMSGAGAPLAPGVPPSTSDSCEVPDPVVVPSSVTEVTTSCFYGDTPDPEVPAATIEHVLETVDDRELIHIRITFNPDFVDNTYGNNAVGWGDADEMEPPPEMKEPDGMKAPKPKKSGHTFKDLVGSDHVEVMFDNAAGNLTLQIKIDYVSEDSSSPCGYGSRGVTGGDGKVIVGDASDVVAVATSLDRNLNGCGYCLTESSPDTDDTYAIVAEQPNWDYRVVYELWVDASVLGDAGFGDARVESVHASPSKLDSHSVEVESKPCPPDWDTPYCVDGNCGDKIEGPCPPGYVPDLASEGRYCVPE